MLGLEAARCVWPIGSSDGRSCTRNPRRMTLMTQERTNSRSRGWESRCAFLGRRLNWNACHVLGNQNLEEDDTASTKTNRQSSRSKQSNKWKSNKPRTGLRNCVCGRKHAELCWSVYEDERPDSGNMSKATKKRAQVAIRNDPNSQSSRDEHLRNPTRQLLLRARMITPSWLVWRSSCSMLAENRRPLSAADIVL